MLPMFKKSHINTRAIEEYISQGVLKNYSEDSNKKNALKQASQLYKMVEGNLYRHGSEREYGKYGLRVVVHDDEPQRKLDIISKCHMDEMGNHFGMNCTIKNVNKLYYWHGLSSHVKMFLKKCDHCKERSKFSMEEWLEEEKNNLSKKRISNMVQMSSEIKNEIKSLGRIKRATPPETFFIVNAHRKVDLDNLNEDAEMLIDSNNIEFVVETLGNSEDGQELKEVCHVLNVQDIIPLPERYRSREIENFLKYGSYPSDFTSNQKSGLKGPAVQYSIVDDELYHIPSKKKGDSRLKLVVHDDNPALKVKILVESHLDEDGNHLGLNRTMQKVNDKYFWLGLSLDTRKFMARCKICSHNRGKRFDEDTSRFSEEVKKLKERQTHQETGTSMEEVFTAYTVNGDGTVHGASQNENYDQVYRLVGNDENDVTEITVKVVNGEIVQTVQQPASEAIQLGEAELVAMDAETEGTAVKEKQPEERSDETSEVAEIEQTSEDGNMIIKIEDTEHPESEPTVIVAGTVEGAVTQPDKTSGDNDASGVNSDSSSASTDNVVSVEAAIEMLVDNESCKLSQSPESGDAEQSPVVTIQPSESRFYEQCIYVPRSKKTRAIEKYLEHRTVTMGYTSTKLKELAENFMIEDDIMYRRASRYKGRHIVIHDDQPQLKLKIINEHHRKPNGDHCSEMITFTNVQYKFYWEELRWDVNRFYSKCNICVEDGIEIKTKKRVRSVKELQMKEYEHRKRLSDLGSNAKRIRTFREENKNKLEKFKSWEKYGKDTLDDVLTDDAVEDGSFDTYVEEVETDDVGLVKKDISMDDESDIEINLDEGSDVETTSEDMVSLTVYATQEQETKIREMFQARGWKYKLDSMIRCPNQSDETRKEDLYEMMMMTTTEQDLAIQELFKSGKEDVETESREEEPKHDQPEHNQPEHKPEEDKPEHDQSEHEQSDEDKPEHDQPEEEESRHEVEEKPDKTKTAVTNKPSPTKEPKKTPVKKTKKEIDGEHMERASNKGTKRTAVDLNESNTESRRPRREIKRPRRFSPDRMEEERKSVSPKKTPKITDKSKIVSPKEPSTKQSKIQVETIELNVTSGRRSARKNDSSVSKSPKKSDIEEISRETTARTTPCTPTRATRYSVRNKDVPSKCEPSTDKPGQKRKAEPTDSKSVKDTTESKQRLKQEHVYSKKTQENTDESRQSEIKNSIVTNVVEEHTLEPDKEVGSEHNPAVSLEEESKGFIYDDDDEDPDDPFSDEGDFPDDETSVDDTALEVLNVDKEFEMEVICIDGLYMCSLCDAEFESDKDCKVHGFQNKCYVSCDLCGRLFRKNEKVELEKHKALHDISEKCPCPSCEKVFTDSKCLEIHTRSHTGKKEEHCRLCAETFYTSFQLASHVYRVHGESNLFNCDICKAKFVNMNFMKSEVLFDGVLSYFKCVMCNK